LACRRERSLGCTAIKWCGVHAAVWCVLSTHWWIWTSGTDSGRKSVSAWWSTELLTRKSSTRAKASSGSEWPRTRCSSHGGGAHSEARWRVHWRGKRISNHSSPGSTCTTAETANVLREVMISASVRSALPVTSSEGYHTRIPTTHMTHSVTVAAHMVRRRHH
jgi:hypothetical protein